MQKGKCTNLLLISVFFCATPLFAATPSFKLKCSLPSTDYQVYAISSTGKVYTPSVKGKTATLSIPLKSLANTSLYATKSGVYVGPVYGRAGKRGLLFLNKKPTNRANAKIVSSTLKLSEPASGENFLFAKKSNDNLFNKRFSYNPENTPALGLNTVKSSPLKERVRNKAVSSLDSDSDGVVNTLDVDQDGDGIANLADASESNQAQANDGSSAIPYTSLYLSMRDSVNWHIGGSLSSSDLDALIAAENKFAVAFYFTPSQNESNPITGGNIVCDEALRYCRPTVGAETGTGVYSGFSEGNQSLVGQLWSSITTNGHEYSLENLQGSAYAASIQPRVGTEYFRPGDNYRADFTNSAGNLVESRTLTLPPYFIDAPALRSFNVSSDSAVDDQNVDYSNSNSPGMNPGNPITVSSVGPFAGKLRITFWRLQRLAVRPDESGSDYRDYGHLNYGVTINNNSGEFTCGGLYSNTSSSLTEVSSSGAGGSFKTSDGANIWPLVDGSDDFEPSAANDSTTLERNTLSFTVDLSSCLDRVGATPGVHMINLLAAGIDTGHGANRAGQNIYVNIP